MLCWSLSFYPQPINNFRRRSTYGLAIDFPTINVLGFVCYAIYAAAFLYSPLIHEQYAVRNPQSPDPSVRFNDLAFAVHAVVLSSLVYSQFYPAIWGFKVARYQRVSKPIAGLFWGSLVAVAGLVFIVLRASPDGGNDALSWAWIDVVRWLCCVRREGIIPCLLTMDHIAVWDILCQGGHHSGQVRPAGMAQLQAQINSRLGHSTDSVRSFWRGALHWPANSRLEFRG